MLDRVLRPARSTRNETSAAEAVIRTGEVAADGDPKVAARTFQIGWHFQKCECCSEPVWPGSATDRCWPTSVRHGVHPQHCKLQSFDQPGPS